MAGERVSLKNSHHSRAGENSKFRNNHEITILGIPGVLVREAVHVRVAVAVSVPVRVRHEEMCAVPSFSPPANHDRLNLMRDIEVYEQGAPTDYIFVG